jgi:hypothetical protein
MAFADVALMTLGESNSWIIVMVRSIDQKNIATAFIQNDPRQCLLDLEFSLDPDGPVGFPTLPCSQGILASYLQVFDRSA